MERWQSYFCASRSRISSSSTSDFGGGGTDARGHILKGAFAIEKNWTAGFSYFINETGLDAGSKRDYDRLQVDLAFKY